MVERRINDISEVINIGIFRDIMNQNEVKPRLCLEHTKSVSQRDEGFSEVPDVFSNGRQDLFTPLHSVIFSGCCDNAIDQELEFIKLTVSEYQKNNPPQIIGL